MPLSLPTDTPPWRPPWEPSSSQLRAHYHQQGVAILPAWAPDALMTAYERAYERAGVFPLGWPDCVPYTRIPELRELCLCDALVEVVEHLIGQPCLLHLNLTGWVSTERAWHQDTYLNPPEVGDAYLAVWIALDTVHPEAGPFEWFPQSHRWPVLSREAVFRELGPEQQADPDWPRQTEELVAPLWEAEAARRGVTARRFLAGRGDVLLWHPRLVHRGSPPLDFGRSRKAVIAHYSGDRADMPAERRIAHGRAHYYLPPGPVPA